MAKKHTETDVIELGPYRTEAVPEYHDEDDSDEVTKPHSLPRLMRPSSDPATVEDVRQAFEELWDRVDRLKVRSNRQRRDTDRQLKDVQSAPKQLSSLNFKMKIIWWVGGVLLAGTMANLIAGAKYLYGKGSSDAEQAYTIKLLVETSSDHGKRLREVENNSIKIIQRLDDLLGRRGRNDAATGPSPTRGSNP